MEQPQNQNDPIIFEKNSDPVVDLFGNAKMYGDEEDNIPIEIQELLEEHGLGRRTFQCVLKYTGRDGEIPNASSPYIRTFKSGVPSPDFIGKNYGPGEYLLLFSWRAKDSEGKMKPYKDERPISISDKFEETYREYQFQRRIEMKKKQRAALEAAKVDRMLGLDIEEKETDAKQAGKEYLEDFMNTSKMLGLNSNNNGGGGGMGGVLKELIPIMPAILAFFSNQAQANQDRSEKFMMMMAEMSRSSSAQMFEVLKSVNTGKSPNDSAKEFKEMLYNVIDIKKEIGDEKESALDKVLETVKSVAPMITSLMSAKASQNSMPVQMAQKYVAENPDFQAVQNDPELLKILIERLDTDYGVEGANGILATMKVERPIDPNKIEIPETVTEVKEDNETDL